LTSSAVVAAGRRGKTATTRLKSKVSVKKGAALGDFAIWRILALVWVESQPHLP
jgi:hypothetical protein